MNFKLVVHYIVFDLVLMRRKVYHIAFKRKSKKGGCFGWRNCYTVFFTWKVRVMTYSRILFGALAYFLMIIWAKEQDQIFTPVVCVDYFSHCWTDCWFWILWSHFRMIIKKHDKKSFVRFMGFLECDIYLELWSLKVGSWPHLKL